MSELEVYVTDTTGEIVAQIDDFQSLNVLKKFNDVGSWSIDLRTDINPSKYFLPRAGIVIKRNSKEIMSGPMTSIARSKNVDADHLTINGADYNILLNQRLTWPCDADHYSPDYSGEFKFSNADSDVFEGVAELVMKHYVEKNMTDNAWDAGIEYFGWNAQTFRTTYNGIWPDTNVYRSVPGLTIGANKGLGQTLKASARLVRLLILLKSLARSGGGLGFAIERAGHGSIIFDVTQPLDKSRFVRFSVDQGNMSAFDYSIAMPTSTYGLVGGSDESTDRTFYEWWRQGIGPYEAVPGGVFPNYPAETWGRIEADIVDGKDDEVRPFPEAYDALSQGQAATAISFKYVENASTKYGESFDLGEIVTVDIDGFKIQDTVTSLQFQYANGQPEVITPTVGDPEAKNPLIPEFFGRQKRMSIQLAALQAR